MNNLTDKELKGRDTYEVSQALKYKMIKSSLIIVCSLLILIFSGIVHAESNQPTQQYNKILLTPFYVQSMTQNTNYTYNVSVITPDGISQIKSAILTLDAWISPTRIFNAYVNNVQCNTKNYTISTTYSSAGRGVVTFDCTNAILGNKINTVTFIVTGGNIGSSTAWLDLTYMNNPSATIEVHGTEYTNGENAKVWLQLIDNNNSYISNATCFVDIYYPNGNQYVERSLMYYTEDGIYQYDFVTPNIVGVYPSIALCYYISGIINYYPSNFTIINGTLTSGDITRVNTSDSSYLQIDETPLALGNPRRFRTEFLWNNMSSCKNLPENLLSGITISWIGRWNANPTSDTMSIYIYNYTSTSWLLLSNTITGIGTGVKSVSNSISLNNLSRSGLINVTRNEMKIMFNDTTNADPSTNSFDTDFLYIGCNQFTNPSWQEVKGSSEVHISNINNYNFYSETLCDGKNPDSNLCGELKYNTSIVNQSYGYIEDIITIYNLANYDIDEYYIYKTPITIDCTGLTYIKSTINNVTVDITNISIKGISDLDSCKLSIPIVMSSSDNIMTINIVYENYMRWELDRGYDLSKEYNSTIINYCNSLNQTFIVPIVTNITLFENGTTLICHRAIDDLYWYYYYYENSKLQYTSGDYESYLIESRFYMPELYNWYNEFNLFKDVVINYTPRFDTIDSSISNVNLTMNNRFDLLLINITQYYNNILSYIVSVPFNVWNYINRNLTYYPTINATVDYNFISDYVWNNTGRYVHGVLI